MSYEDSISMAHVGKAWKLVDHYCEEAAQPWNGEEKRLHYTIQSQLIRPLKPWMEVGAKWGLFSKLKERFKTAKKILHGAFPEIRRAWALLDNDVYMWSFDESDQELWQYSNKSKPVIDVGLVKPQPGFVEDAQYLVVWVTPRQLYLSKVCISDGEQHLEPVIAYKTTSDVACILCTGQGRIFVAGQNGHIYELMYNLGISGYLLCCTPISSSNLVNRFMFGASDHVVEMVVDNQRKTLYTRTKKAKLEAYFLGMNGDSSIEKLGEVYCDPSVVSISPLSQLESKWSHAHLVAVLSDGSRRYFSTSSSGFGWTWKGSLNNQPQTPDCFRLVTAKDPPSFGKEEDSVYMKVEPAYCSVGTLFLSRPLPDYSSSSVLVVGKDSSSCTLVGGISALRELKSTLLCGGRMLFAAEVLPTPDASSTMLSLYSHVLGEESYENTCRILRGRGDLLTQHLLPKKTVLVFTTTAVTELLFNRPADILYSILNESKFSIVLINDFLAHFGGDETAAMCLMLASRIMFGAGESDSLVSRRAADLFEDMKVVRMLQLDAKMVPDEFVHSAAHKGLYLCTSRLLYPLWNSCVLSERSSSGDGVLICRFSTDAMHELQSKLRSLGKYLIWKSDAEDSSGGELANVRQGLPDIHNHVSKEDVRSMECCRHLIKRSAEALFLLQILSRHDIAIRTRGCEESLRRTLLQLEFRQLVHSEEDDQIAKVLISAIMERNPFGGDDGTSDILLEGCPSYSKEALFWSSDCIVGIPPLVIRKRVSTGKSLRRSNSAILS